MLGRLSLAVAAVGLGCNFSSPAGLGKACEVDKDCRGALMCIDAICAVAPSVHQDMAKKSGVELKGETSPAPATVGSVKVRSASGFEVAFAICSQNERLTNGWCEPTVFYKNESYRHVVETIDGHTANDTIGARWVCNLRGSEVTAKALCQVIAIPESATH